MDRVASLLVILLLPACCLWVAVSGLENNRDGYNDDYILKHVPLESLPTHYDFIVVGAGAAGSFTAATIAQAFPHREVLIVEGGIQGQRATGGTDFVAAKTKTDRRTGKLILDPIPWTRYDIYEYVGSIYAGEFFLNNTWGINNFIPGDDQHKVIGGNMVANGMAWIKPSKFSLDQWNLPGFSGEELWPFYKAVENVTGLPVENNTADYGTHGPVQISPPNVTPLPSSKFSNVCAANGFEFVGDGNDGDLGIGYFTSTHDQRNGVRDSSSVAILVPTMETHKNLKLARGCIVTQVLFDDGRRLGKTAEGVECIDWDGKTHKFYASRETILAAGTLQTPKILFNSGIGPLSILQAFDKPQRVINERIGQKIMNQQVFSLIYEDLTIPSPNFYDLPLISTAYAVDGSGNFGCARGTYLSVKVDPSHPVPDVLINYAIATTAPPGGLYSQEFGLTVNLSYQFYQNGTLNLTSSDPLANTTWKSNLFQVQEDLQTMIKGVKKTREVMKLWPTATELYPGPSVQTDAQIAAAILANGTIVGHFSGSVPMGLTPEFPLDVRMRVKGVNKLRVTDTSGMPQQISRGMMASACMMGLKGASLVIEDNL